jgi:hypothetical protein
MLVLPLAPQSAVGQAASDPVRPEDTEVWTPVPEVVTPSPAGPAVAPPSDAVILFDGTGLEEWVNARDGASAGWTVLDGILTVDKTVGDIETRRSFRDYQLHLEWRIPESISGEGQARGNSGLFLSTAGTGYEVQILDSFENSTYANGMAASYTSRPSLLRIPAVRPASGRRTT